MFVGIPPLFGFKMNNNSYQGGEKCAEGNSFLVHYQPNSFFFFKLFILYRSLADQPVNNIVIASSEQSKDSAIYIQVSILLHVVLEKAREGSLACCSPQGRKESDTTERLN